MADRDQQSEYTSNVIGKPGVDKVDFELWCLAVSAINGCGLCVDSHENVLREKGVTDADKKASQQILR